MARRCASDDAEALARRRRYAADVARWRLRQRREVELFQIEAGRFEYDLCVKYGGLRENQLDDKAAVAAVLGKLLRAGLVALIERNTRRR